MEARNPENTPPGDPQNPRGPKKTPRGARNPPGDPETTAGESIWPSALTSRNLVIYPPTSLSVERVRLQPPSLNHKSKIPLPQLPQFNQSLEASSTQIPQFAFQDRTFSCFKAFQNSFARRKNSRILSPGDYSILL